MADNRSPARQPNQGIRSQKVDDAGLRTKVFPRWRVAAIAEWPEHKCFLLAAEDSKEILLSPAHIYGDYARLMAERRDSKQLRKFIESAASTDAKVYALLDYSAYLRNTPNGQELETEYGFVYHAFQPASARKALLEGSEVDATQLGVNGPITPETSERANFFTGT